MPAIDINRTTTNVIMNPELSREIWAKTLEESAIMQLARRINMPGAGVDIQTITSEPEANWVDETAVKPVDTHEFGKKTIRPYKLAIIEPFSDEFRRDKRARLQRPERRAQTGILFPARHYRLRTARHVPVERQPDSTSRA